MTFVTQAFRPDFSFVQILRRLLAGLRSIEIFEFPGRFRDEEAQFVHGTSLDSGLDLAAMARRGMAHGLAVRPSGQVWRHVSDFHHVF